MILISSPSQLQGEADLLNSMFDAGLPLLHLRKPTSKSTEIENILEGIKPIYRSQISLHQHHHLAEKFGLKRIHFTEKKRNETLQNVLDDMIEKKYILSTSVHSVKAYNVLNVAFQYVFLSPVFDSISKKNYPAVAFDLSEKSNTLPIKLIALGGLNRENHRQVLEKGFDDYALLGSIWNTPDPLGSLKYFLNK